MNNISAAGGIVLKENRILFIFKKGKWDLPKGKIDPGSSPEHTAIKEISEETGLREEQLKIKERLVPTFHFTRYNREKVLKKTHWFLLEYSGDSSELKPQKEEFIVHCEWIPLWELDRVLSKTHVRIAYLVDFFLRWNNLKLPASTSLKFHIQNETGGLKTR